MKNNMEFTYEGYYNLIKYLRDNDYEITDYFDYRKYKKAAILRHDVDYSLEKAVELAKLENDLGAKSTYFIMLTSDFYNVFSKKSKQLIKEITELGHEIGLHFDEVLYSAKEISKVGIANLIKKEAIQLSEVLDYEIKAVSMHRPSKETLQSDIKIEGLINSYSREFFNNFKYVSDSRMRWREDVLKVIKEKNYDKLHILTHAFWYFEEEKDIKNIVSGFIDEANKDRYCSMKENITDIDQILGGDCKCQ